MPITPEIWRHQNISSLGRDLIELSDGRILASKRLANGELGGELFNQFGNPIGSSFQMNTVWNGGLQSNMSMSALADGGWIVVYESEVTAGSAIRMERYNSAGVRIDHAGIASSTVDDHFSPQVAAASASSVLIAYSEHDPATGTGLNMQVDAFYRIYNPITEVLSAEISLAALAGEQNTVEEIIVLDDGNYVLVTSGLERTSDLLLSVDFDHSFINFVIVNAAGGIVRPPATVTDAIDAKLLVDPFFIERTVDSPDIAALAGGGFVMTWIERGIVGANIFRVVHQVFGSAGNEIGNRRYIDSGNNTRENSPELTALDDGGYMLLWDYGLVRNAQRFNSSGDVVSPVFTIGSDARDGEANTALSLSDGRFVFADEDGLTIWDVRDGESLNTASGDWIGTIGNDVMYVASGDGYGWDGDDILIQQVGGGSLYGGIGNDQLRHDGDVVAGGLTVLDGGDGIDEVRTGGASGIGWTVDLANGWIYRAGGNFDTLIRIENVRGSNSNDTITGNGGANTLRGLNGEDVIRGNAGNDIIEGGGGNDQLEGGTGSDTVIGEGGDDRIYQNMEGENSNTLNGGLGIDTWVVGALSGAMSGTDWTIDLTGDLSTGGATKVYAIDIENVESGGGNDTIIGTSASNSLSGGGGNDVIDGHAGDDTILGGAGVDTLNGGDDNDTLDGGAENDTLNGGSGADTLNGGDGDDILNGDANDDIFFDGRGNDIINGGSGNDTVYIHSTPDADTDTVDGGSGNDTLSEIAWNWVVDTGPLAFGLRMVSGNQIVDLVNIETLILGAAGQDIRNGSGLLQIQTGSGQDTFSVVSTVVSIDSGGGNDTFNFTESLNTIGDGATYNAGTGVDLLKVIGFSWAATDTIRLGGIGTVDHGATTFQLTGFDNYDGSDNTSFSDETVYGTSEANTILLGAGDNRAYGGNGADVLNGGAGNDRLFGEGGNDTLIGGDGDDWLNGSFGQDSLDGGNGNDTADYGYTTVDNTIDLTLGIARATSATAGETLTSIENIMSGSGDDILIGDSGANILNGGAGADMIDGLGGFDFVSYEGHAVGVTVNLDVLVWLGVAARTGFDGIDIDTLRFIEMAIGSSHSDTLYGSASRNTLDGGDGNDTLVGRGGNDTLIGGAGDDVLQGQSGVDIADYSSSIGAVTVDLGLGTAADGFGGSDILVSIEQIVGSRFDDTLIGGTANESLSGGDGIDIVQGGDGNDTLYGGNDADELAGGNGNDRLYGEDGDDNILGDAGADTIDGGAGHDVIEGGDDGDRLYGRFGDDTLLGGNGSDFLYGQEDDDTLFGGEMRDYLQGGAGNDMLHGEAGDDRIDGGANIDTAVYSGMMGDYNIILRSNGVLSVEDLNTGNGDDGYDTLTNVEFLQFADGVIDVAGL